MIQQEISATLEIVKQRSNSLNLNTPRGDTQEGVVNGILKETQNASFSNFGNLSVTYNSPDNTQQSKPHGSVMGTNISTDIMDTVSCDDLVTVNGQMRYSKDNSSRIPLRIKPRPGSPNKRISPIRKPGFSKIPQNVQYFYAKSQKEPSFTQRRSLEMQFQHKKQQMDHLQNEIFDKQKILSEMCENLVQLRKKLKLCGIDIPLSNIDLLNCEEGWKKNNTVENRHETRDDFKITPETIQNMNSTIQQICKFLMIKRLELVEVLEKISKDPTNRKRPLEDLQPLEDLEKGDFSNPKDFENYSSFSNQIKLLQEKLNNKEQKLAKVTTELEESQQKNTESTASYEKIINELKEQNKRLEHEINQNQVAAQIYKEKADTYEQHIQSLQQRGKETEEKLRKAESRYGELQKAIRY